MGSTCSQEGTAEWSWSGRCRTSSSSLPIQDVTQESGPWHCLMTRGASFLAWLQEASCYFTTTLTGGIMNTKPATDGDSCAFTLPLGWAEVSGASFSSTTSECNLNLLKAAKYFLKLLIIAIFVVFAWLFWGDQQSRKLAAGFCSFKKSIFLVIMRSLFSPIMETYSGASKPLIPAIILWRTFPMHLQAWEIGFSQWGSGL